MPTINSDGMKVYLTGEVAEVPSGVPPLAGQGGEEGDGLPPVEGLPRGTGLKYFHEGGKEIF